MRKEKYIKVKKYKGNTYFTVQFSYKQLGKTMTYSHSFNSADYDSPAQALNEACKHRDLKRAEMLTKGLPANQKATVKDMFEASFEIYKRSGGTEENLRKYFRKYFTKYENMDIKDVDDWLITAHLESVKDTVSDNMISRIFTVWKRICKTAKSRKLVNDIATDTVEKPASTYMPEERQKIFTDEDTAKVIESLKEHCHTESQAYNNSVMISMIIVCRYTGLRPQEVKGIRRDDVDFENNLLYIRRSIGADGIRPVKTKSSIRVIPMIDKVRTELLSLMAFASYDYIFKFHGNYWPDAKELATAFNYYARLAGVPGWHLYSQRHAFDTELILAGVDPRTVMELMGHSSTNMTLGNYAHSNIATKEKALELVENGRKN